MTKKIKEKTKKTENKRKNKYALIVLVAGSSKRFKSKIKKQFITVDGKPIFVHTIEAVLKFKFDRIILVTAKKDEKTVKRYIENSRIIKKYIVKNLVEIVEGGSERIYSVYNAMKYLKSNNPPKYVFIHDGVRPLVKLEELKMLEKSLIKNKAAILATKMVDTVKKVDSNNNITKTIDRTDLYRALTPQAFSFLEYYKSLEKYIRNIKKIATDDAEIYSAYAGKVSIVDSSSMNIKITEKKDLTLYLKLRK